MRIIRAAWAVFGFECRRQMAWSRMLFALGLALFPAAILWLINHEGGELRGQQAVPLALFALIPEIVCLLGLLLWITPIVQAEVEGKTWPYLVVRPAGKFPVLLGKYAAGVLWTMLVGWLALSMGLLVTTTTPLPEPRTTPGNGAAITGVPADAFPGDSAQTRRRTILSPEQAFHAWKIIACLVALSSLAYGSLFALLGVVFLRRGMIFAVAYTLLEFIVRWIPAMIKQMTVQYHLQGLLVHWMHWADKNPQLEAFFGAAAPGQHVLVLLGYAVFLLAVAGAILRRRELVAAAEAAP